MFRKVFVTILSLSLIFFSCCYAYADGRTSDEVIRKQYTRPTGYDPLGQMRDKYNYSGNIDTDCYTYDDSSVTTSKTTSSKPTTSSPANTSKPNSSFAFDSNGFTFKYIRHEVGEDKNGNPTLFYYYNLTNKSGKTNTAMTIAIVNAFQNGVECDDPPKSWDIKEVDNRLKDLRDGGSVDLCAMFSISDKSDVVIEITDWFDGTPVKKEHTISLQ